MSWSIVATVGSALIGGAVSLYEGAQNRGAQSKSIDEQNAENERLNATSKTPLQGYTESDAARGTWWNTLQDWGKSGSYGANLPNYDKVFENARNRINQYYWGGPSGGGLIDKIRSGAAQRNMSDSPAIDVLTQRAGAKQAGQLGDISTNLDVTKANAIESARTNWLNSITSLSNLKPQYMGGGVQSINTFVPSDTGAGQAISSGAASIYEAYQQNKSQQEHNAILNSYLNNNKTTQSSIMDTSIPVYSVQNSPETKNWLPY